MAQTRRIAASGDGIALVFTPITREREKTLILQIGNAADLFCALVVVEITLFTGLVVLQPATCTNSYHEQQHSNNN